VHGPRDLRATDRGAAFAPGTLTDLKPLEGGPTNLICSNGLHARVDPAPPRAEAAARSRPEGRNHGKGFLVLNWKSFAFATALIAGVAASADAGETTGNINDRYRQGGGYLR
jgi:hypothetical protein